MHWTAPQYMALNPVIKKQMASVIDNLNKGLEPHERVRDFILLHEEWTPEKEELTFTMKLNREVLRKRYAKEIGELTK